MAEAAVELVSLVVLLQILFREQAETVLRQL